jgi:ribonuclease HI
MKQWVIFTIEPTNQVDECQNIGDIWTLEFDSANSSSGFGARIFLVTPSHEATLFSCNLEFDCTNNIVENEALIIGLNIYLNRNTKCLIRVIGDSNLIVSQVKRKFVANNENLRRYRNLIWDTIEIFGAFSIRFVPIEKNHIVYALAISSTTLKHCEEILHDIHNMEVVFHKYIFDNLEHWKLLNDDSQILCFLQISKEFSYTQFNLLTKSVRLRIEDLPNDTLPKGFVPL